MESPTNMYEWFFVIMAAELASACIKIACKKIYSKYKPKRKYKKRKPRAKKKVAELIPLRKDA